MPWILVLCFLGWPLGREGAGEVTSQPGACLGGKEEGGQGGVREGRAGDSAQSQIEAVNR